MGQTADSSKGVMICRFFYVFIIWFLSFESVTGSQYGVGYTMNRPPSYPILVCVVLTQYAVVHVVKFKLKIVFTEDGFSPPR